MEQELKILKGDSSKLMIGGFGQGMSMALHVGVYFKELPGCIIGISGVKLTHI